MNVATDVLIQIVEVAIYLRKSRGESERDLLKHKTLLIELCEKNKWKYVIYEEIESADTIEYRPKMQELLRDVKQDLFDGVLVVEYDRLSRGDKEDQASVEKTLASTKTLIITPQKVFNLENESDAMLTDFLGMLARYEYKQITKRFVRGKKMGAKLGNWINGVPPFPYRYDRESKSIKVDEDKLLLYYEMKRRVLAAEPMLCIAEDINQRGYRTNKGKLWTDTAIRRILLNQVHLGHVVYGKSSGAGHLNRNTKPLVYHDESDWTITKNAHQAVITEEEFDKIQELLRRNKNTPKKARSGIYPLSGIIKCGKCGHAVVHTENKWGVFLKKCWKPDGFGNRCDNRGIKQDFILNIIKERLNELEERLIKENKTLINNESSRLKQELELKTKELGKQEKALERIRDLYEIGDYDREEFLDRRDKRQKGIEELKKQIEQIKKAIKINEKISNDDRLKHIRSLNTFWDQMDHEGGVQKVNRALKLLINRITYTRTNDDIELDIEFY